MKRIITNILFGLIFLIGFGILIYPTVSNLWNNYRQSKLITSYEQVVKEMEAEDFSEEWVKAESFNVKLQKNNIYVDAFGAEETDLKDTEYWQVLNVGNDGVMGYLSIPKINVKLAIYHGTEEAVLQTGVGHLNGSKLPIGGESTHSVLAAHRGLPSAKLFTDIDQLKRGDMFYIYVMDQVFAYQVDQIKDMVDKDDSAALESALSIVEGEDYVTLFTCTPYGVNSHRLLVRGTRVPYEGEEQVEAEVPESMLKSLQEENLFNLMIGLSGGLVTLWIIKFVIRINYRRRRKKHENIANSKEEM